MPEPVVGTATLRWSSTGGTLTEPAAGHKDTGWVSAEEPPAGYFNWWMNGVYLWLVYLDGLPGEAITWTAAHIFQAGITVNNTAALSAITGNGGPTGGNGVVGNGGVTSGSGTGVVGFGGLPNGHGVSGAGAGTGVGVAGTGGTGNADGVRGTATGTGAGVVGLALGATYGVGTQGVGVYAKGGTAGGAVLGEGGAGSASVGGTGVFGSGGAATSGFIGGSGVDGLGGSDASSGTPGIGVKGRAQTTGGTGVHGQGTGSVMATQLGAALTTVEGGRYAGGVFTGTDVGGDGGYGAIIAGAESNPPKRAALKLTAQQAEPTVASIGDVIVKASGVEIGKMFCYNGATWQPVGGRARALCAGIVTLNGTATPTFSGQNIASVAVSASIVTVTFTTALPGVPSANITLDDTLAGTIYVPRVATTTTAVMTFKLRDTAGALINPATTGSGLGIHFSCFFT